MVCPADTIESEGSETSNLTLVPLTKVKGGLTKLIC